MNSFVLSVFNNTSSSSSLTSNFKSFIVISVNLDSILVYQHNNMLLIVVLFGDDDSNGFKDDAIK